MPIRILKKDNTRKENRLEELGRVDAEKADTKKGKQHSSQPKKVAKKTAKYRK
jgi:hypothetical protein